VTARTCRTRLASERGSIAISGLLLAVVLAMLLGVVVDLGQAFLARRELASIADDAALAGSQDIDIPALHEGRLELNPTQARTDALHTIGGYSKTRGEVSTTGDRVNVTVTRRVQTILLGLVGLHTFTISAHASAAPRAP
jgi:Flp pilus assembly protein TadG